MRTTCKFFDSNLLWRSPPAAAAATAATVVDKPRIASDISTLSAIFGHLSLDSFEYMAKAECAK